MDRGKPALMVIIVVVLLTSLRAQASPGDLGDLARSMGGPRGGSVVVDHPPQNTGGPAADLDFINTSGQRTWQQLAHDFNLTQPAEVGHINYWGFYTLDNPPAVEEMRVRVLGARTGDGLPDEGNVVYQQTFPNPQRTATGRRVAVGIGPHEYLLQIDLSMPLSLQAGVPYWLEVLQLDDVNTAFRWEYSPGSGTAFAFLNANVPDWQLATQTSDLAFQLVSIPEPSAIALLAIGFAFIRWKRGA
jgi:hypothetical protein